MHNIYLDNAATTPIAKEVIEEMTLVLKNNFGNPSSIHHFGRQAKVIIEKARKQVADCFSVSPGEIFFTSCGTEANNMVISGIINGMGIKNVITSAIEHHAVLHTLAYYNKLGLTNLMYVNILENGSIDLTHLEELLKANSPAFVSLMHANNEIGNLLPIKKVGELCMQYQSIFHSDTVQSVAHYPINLQNIPIHFITCSAHKFHGPKGIGFLYVNGDIKIPPFIHGGSQERNMRGGTENIYGIAGLAKALQLAYYNLEMDMEYISSIKQYMINKLKTNFPGVKFNGESEKESSLYTVLNVRFPETENKDMFLMNLDIQGIAASGGSACSSGSNQNSHVLNALNVSNKCPSVRFSFSKYNTVEEIDYCIKVLKEC